MEGESKYFDDKSDKEVWEAIGIKIRELKCSIFQELKRLHGRGDDPDEEYNLSDQGWGAWDDIKGGWEQLVGNDKKYLKKFLVYHIFIGSSTDRERSPYADLPGNKSLIDYLGKILEELRN